MRTICAVALLAIFVTTTASVRAKDDSARVKAAVERSTLDQPGTSPFHLKAVVAPTRERDRDSGRYGEIEIWWASPTRFRREVRSPEFHQVEIVDGQRHWQKSDGPYFPEWLRETAAALIQPIPALDEVLREVRDADVKRLMGSTYYQWSMMSTDGNVQKGLGASVALTDSTGLLFYCGGLGWGAIYHDYQKFHDRVVARTVGVGSPEVTAKITVLEDLDNSATDLFDTQASGSDAQPLETVTVEELVLRKNLLTVSAPVWPPAQDGPLDGAFTAKVVVDREGRVRDIGTVVGDNAALADTAKSIMGKMRFKPYLVDGNPVQVVSRMTMPFKTTRPAGTEKFESAQAYFERGRNLDFLAGGSGTDYVLRAEFEAASSAGGIGKGRYEDTWLSDDQWRREAWFGKSHYVRSRNGDKRYQFSEGPDAALLPLVFRALEPIPAMDTFVESDWRIKRDEVDGVRTLRIFSGYESPDGKLDPEHARGYWFDDSGLLVKTYFKGIETRRSEFKDYGKVKIPYSLDVLKDGQLGMRIRVDEVTPAGPVPAKTFEVPGHTWQRAFTDEER